jgi:arylsulfatase A-like enzyme
MADDEPEWFERIMAQAQKAGPGGESVTGYIGETSAVPPERHFEGWLTRKALEFLDSGRDSSRPFCLYLSFDYPHAGLHVPPGFEELYDMKDFPDTPPPEPFPQGHRYRDRFEDIWPKMSPEQRRRSRLRYAALCSYVDDLFGQVLAKLREMNELENTFIIFTSDHGDMMGDRGRVSKYCLYEGSVRVPLMIAGHGVKRHGAVDERPAELVDVVPTLLDAAGLEIPETLAGLSLLSDSIRPGSFAEMHGRGYEEYQRAPAVMYRTKEWKLILHLPGKLGDVFQRVEQLSGELYRLSDDPLELNNRYADKACAEVRERLTAQALMNVMCSLGRYPSSPMRTKIRITGPETKPDGSIWS